MAATTARRPKERSSWSVLFVFSSSVLLLSELPLNVIFPLNGNIDLQFAICRQLINRRHVRLDEIIDLQLLISQYVTRPGLTFMTCVAGTPGCVEVIPGSRFPSLYT